VLRNRGRPGGCLAYELPAEERNPAPDVRRPSHRAQVWRRAGIPAVRAACGAAFGSVSLSLALLRLTEPVNRQYRAGSSTCDRQLRALLFRPIDNLAHDESSIMTAEAEAVAERGADR
jgi:hypothetical protein